MQSERGERKKLGDREKEGENSTEEDVKNREGKIEM